ncbi:CCA tRNA nucleotidyltransferase [Candidatus Woesearchaeota archaeon]|nr:CCA tRNA nucleotidyltransferase [Candidatus Woesearchaeota archaeon]
MNPILTTIKPIPEEQQKVAAVTQLFIKRLNSKLSVAEAILGGSGAKGTWLSGNHDLDIFVLFPLKEYSSRSAELSQLLEKSLKQAFPKLEFQRIHGSRDYFQVVYEKFNIEIVPILKISRADQAVNITDISPLHTRWVQKQPVKVKDEIMLAKQFCKANEFYGAESYIGGFSGYVLEIIVSYYGSFEKMLRASLKWKNGEVIDVEKAYPKKNALFHLNQSKIRSPLIVIDPVDKNRNAAAALTEEKWLLFRRKAAEYLKKPSPSFFEKKKIDRDSWKEAVRSHSHHGVWIDLNLAEGKEDVIGVKIVKAMEFIRKELSPFVVVDARWAWDKKQRASLFIELERATRAVEEIKPGPPLSMKEYVADFQKKNKNTYVEKGRIMAKVKISQTSLEDNLRSILKKEYLADKIKSLEKTTFV